MDRNLKKWQKGANPHGGKNGGANRGLRASEQQGNERKAEYTLPGGFFPLRRDFKGYQSLDTFCPPLHDISVRTGTRIGVVPRATDFRTVVRIEGNSDKIRAAIQFIREWTKETNPDSQKHGAFPKLQAYNQKRVNRTRRTEQQAMVQSKFLEEPPKNDTSLHKLEAAWDENDPERFRELQKQLGGSSFPAFDPIRRQLGCWIFWDSEINSFKLMGEIQKNLEEAKIRVQNTYYTIKANSYILEAPIFLVKPFPTEKVAMMAYSTPYFQITTARSSQGFDLEKPKRVFIAKSISSGDQKLQAGAKELGVEGDGNQKRFEGAVIEALRRVNYLRGMNITMMASLGRFTIQKWENFKDHDDSYSLDEFHKFLNRNDWESEVTKELGDKTIERILLDTLMAVPSNVLVAEEPRVQNLADLKPTYGASFTMLCPKGEVGLGNLRYDIEYDTTDGMASNVSKRWSRLDQENELTTQMDVVMLDIREDHFSWNFKLMNARTVDESTLPPAYTSFVKSMTLDMAALERGDPDPVRSIPEEFVETPPILSVSQTRSYKFQVTGTGYVVELQCFTNCFFDRAVDPRNPPRKEVEPRWGIRIYHKNWACTFAASGLMGIGERLPYDTSHSAISEKFFTVEKKDIDGGTPADKGLEKFRSVLDKIEGIVATANKKPRKAETEEEEEDLMVFSDDEDE
ncbi:hypothetical protein M501DRAFT_1013474 [Patellaria atrata CBS 101060]|uniref:DUF7905 domain-containing protein n=1 Tax=Patellaria atrata CBS 101060 TaxID=1346257 RepID=A0A9P4VUL7_9PEZI|nr:hypothetical protein M501DRAFT_1013474 [Patellaria atrata CBS 101060]